MARFSTVFRLGNEQAALDFLDVELTTDNRFYLDPYAIEIRDDEWSQLCGDHIRSFFNEVLAALRLGNDHRALQLLGHLHEPNETFLGESRGSPSGRGVGEFKASQFADALRNSRAFATGLLSDISEAELFIHGVGPDTISDLTTNILRGLLADYTRDQCELHGVTRHPIGALGPRWSIPNRRWESTTFNLPVYRGRPVLLVPKFSVRFRLSLDSQEFYNHYMLEFLKQENLQAGTALVHVFKNGRRDVFKTDLKKIHPFVKDDLATFAQQHPEVLEEYKRLKGAQSTPTATDIEKFFDEAAFAQALITRLQQVPTGNDAASEYHSVALGICTFLFHPGLINPVREHEIHQGRKRIDIKFSNTGETRFFQSMLASNQTRAISVAVECKNYTKELKNPELDQLAGRFGHQRGFFGLLLCRTMDDRERLVDRCRDTVSDGRGYIIILEDLDLVAMLNLIVNNQRRRIDYYLQQRFDEITG